MKQALFLDLFFVVMGKTILKFYTIKEAGIPNIPMQIFNKCV